MKAPTCPLNAWAVQHGIELTGDLLAFGLAARRAHLQVLRGDAVVAGLRGLQKSEDGARGRVAAKWIGGLSSDVLVVVEEDGNTPLSGDCAVTGRASNKTKSQKQERLVLGNEDMMFSGPKSRGHAHVDCRSKCDSLYRTRPQLIVAPGKRRAHPRFGR